MWISEKVCSSPQQFFDSVCAAINSASSSVLVEMYIFRKDMLGSRLLDAMRSAAARGVDVRIVVDGVGSPAWSVNFLRELAEEKISARVYNPIPGTRLSDNWQIPSIRRVVEFVTRSNNRNHRKLVVVDNVTAFVGSCNVTDVHQRWRETAVTVTGQAVAEICGSFEVIWRRSSQSGVSWSQSQRHKLLTGLKNSSLVRVNCTRKLRQLHNSEIIRRIEKASDRVWITTAYFVPSPVLVGALVHAAMKGRDVRLLLPGKNDIGVVSCVSRMFYLGLMKFGVKIYEYQPSMLHAKTLLVDEWASVGTTNLNHRSLYHDLEVDITLSKPESINSLERQFISDLAVSHEVTQERLQRRSLLEKVSGYIAYPFRTFI